MKLPSNLSIGTFSMAARIGDAPASVGDGPLLPARVACTLKGACSSFGGCKGGCPSVEGGFAETGSGGFGKMVDGFTEEGSDGFGTVVDGFGELVDGFTEGGSGGFGTLVDGFAEEMSGGFRRRRRRRPGGFGEGVS